MLWLLFIDARKKSDTHSPFLNTQKLIEAAKQQVQLMQSMGTMPLDKNEATQKYASSQPFGLPQPPPHGPPHMPYPPMYGYPYAMPPPGQGMGSSGSGSAPPGSNNQGATSGQGPPTSWYPYPPPQAFVPHAPYPYYPPTPHAPYGLATTRPADAYVPQGSGRPAEKG